MTWSVIIGNGFTIDAYNHCDIEYDINKPWSWPLSSPYNSDDPLIDLFPRLKKYLLKRGSLDKLSLYESLQPIINHTQRRPIHDLSQDVTEEEYIHLEASHYLRLAYSWYSKLFTDEKLISWPWFKWFELNGGLVHSILSFNYDLVLERILRLSNLGKVYGDSYDSMPIDLSSFPFKAAPQKAYWDEKPGDKRVIHIAKPHGSCNFTGWCNFVINDGNEDLPIYPLGDAFPFRDNALRILEIEELYQPTTTADLIIPGEWSWWNKSEIAKLRWAKFQKDTFVAESKPAEVLLVIGFSYGEPDQDEFKELFSRLDFFKEIHVIDPNPNDDFLHLLSKKTNDVIAYTGIKL